MIAAITAALVTLCNAATAESLALVRRIHSATVALVSIDSQMAGRCARAVVPDFVYLESKDLYLSLRQPKAARKRVQPAALTPVRAASAVTKSDLRAAVRTILRGEDVNATKPGPRLTSAKRSQIAAAREYQSTHCGCTLHNACKRSFVPKHGGYKSAKSMYEYLRLVADNRQ